MKIVFLEAVQSFGGARKSTVELAKRLKDDGNEVLIIDFWGSCTEFVEKVKLYNLDLEILVPTKKSVVIKGTINKFRTVLNYFLYFFKFLKYRNEVKTKLKNFQPEIIIVNNVKTLSILSKNKSYKIVFFARGWFAGIGLSSFRKALLKKLVDVYIGVSQSTRQAIYSGGFAKLNDIYVVPNAIDMGFIETIKNKVNKNFKNWTDDITNREFIILHCGGFLPSKGQHISIEVAKKLKLHGLNFKMYLVGIIYEGEISEYYYKDIVTKIQKYELSSDVEIILNDANSIDYFAKSDVLIHPSSTEGLPRVIMEAMAFEKPVIANAVGGVTDYILDNFTGYLTNFNNVDEYVDSIIQLSKNKELYSTISKNGYDLVNAGYCPKQQTKTINLVLSKIIKLCHQKK